jgi:arylsulfatase A-like enzyme
MIRRLLHLTLCLVATWLTIGQAAAAEPRPNVLLITVDDLNDWVGCLGGHPQARTPAIDALARRGVLFTNAHCQAPICNPSRVSFMTGMLPSTTGVYLLGPTKFRVSPALKDAATLPEYFSDRGYSTFGVGKIYHASTSQETFGSYGPRGSFGPLPKRKINYTPSGRLWDWGAFPKSDDQMPDDKVAEWAIGQLQKKHDRPFLLAAGLFRPHVPWYAPQKWWDMQPPEDEIKLPKSLADDRQDIGVYAQKLTRSGTAPRHRWFIENKQWRRAVRGYLASIAFADHQVGRILAALAKSRHAENTVVVLLSDHGFALGEKQRWAKRSLWERSTKVPLIIAGPGIKPGRRCAKPVGLIDVYPTLVDLCGLPPNANLEGRSLAPLLDNVGAKWSHSVLTTFFINNHALRSERWRYIRYANGDEELYDHQSDPNEWHNLAGKAKYRDVIAEHARHLPKVNVPPVPNSTGLGVAPQDRALFKVVK